MRTTRFQPRSLAGRRLRAGLLGGLALLFAGGAGYVAMVSRPAPLDAVTLCPLDRRLETSVTIIVDTTDPLTRLQASRLAAAVRDAREALPIHAKLTLLVLDAANPFDPHEILSLCNPGSVRDLNPFTQTASRVARRWRESFEAPIDAAVEALTRAPTAPRSPIIETIAAATARPDFDSRIPRRRLLVVSDLLQHEPGGYSHYTGDVRWQRFASSRLAASAWADLAGVEVEIEYLRRPESARLQSDAHRAFWRDWFLRSGATSVRFFGAPEPPGAEPPGATRMARP
jgi:hypothetical protein